MIKNVKTTIQNNGSRWLIIMQGKAEDIESQFLSFWNLRMTSGELEWNTSTCAQFWTLPMPTKSNKDSVWNYFYNYHSLHSISYELNQELWDRATRLAKARGGFQSSGEYRKAISKLYRRMTHLFVLPKARRSFEDFKLQTTDFNVRLYASADEFKEFACEHEPVEREEISEAIVEA